MANAGVFLLVTAVAFCVTGVRGEWCTRTSDSLWTSNYDIFQCPYGCCGLWPDQYCCTNIVGIAGGVIGVLLFMGGVAVFVRIVKKHQRGQVGVIHTSHPPPTVSGTVVHTQYPPPPTIHTAVYPPY